MEIEIATLLTEIEKLTEKEILELLIKRYPHKVVFSTSFGMEDQVITDFILKNKIPVEIFTLDTGRLFYETYTTWENTNEYYHTEITPYYPDAKAIERYVKDNGINAFYNSVPLRQACCHIRKVEPLKRALAGNKVWITGLRAEQSANREQMKMVEWDETNHIIKVHLLLHWRTEQVLSFLRKNGIPYNPLHDKGYPSIGCAPCTRAIREGEDFRDGRWWWENKTNKECGLHIHK
ncbi:phosphoadenylyl-sulfate reductase [Capnocytophaga sp. oral taxon 338]|uniref:phosphoadenylyl-sulfate reductase n=1 Tax=Capnocytophaga sp. oral taxon 338 TaxID=710239 RepID=UPI000202E4BD|nr:phosphoadenylyl-sulfate reductase [Capnocytophaga sp. oral taxon 338]EGD34153.1 ATP synthase F0 sector subunit A [Capnocytophaga sp. oral taxon 338 str. F0234]